MSQECNCDTPKVSIPLRGIELSFDADAFGNGGSGGAVIPDLRVGVETKWPMRYMGKQVYARLVDCGGLPASATTKVVAHNAPDVDWAQISWDYSYVMDSNSSFPQYFSLFYMQPSGSNRFRFTVSNSDILISTNAGFSSWNTAIVCMLYTKTTDEALP